MDKLSVHYDAPGRTLTGWVGDPATEAGCDEVHDVLIKDERGQIIGFETLNVSIAGESDALTVEVLRGPGRDG